MNKNKNSHIQNSYNVPNPKSYLNPFPISLKQPIFLILYFTFLFITLPVESLNKDEKTKKNHNMIDCFII